MCAQCIKTPKKTLSTLCKDAEEDFEHFFFRCDVVSVAWRKIVHRLNNASSSSGSAWENFVSWSCFCRKKKEFRGKEGIFWLAVMWRIWLLRNDICFNGVVCNLSNLI